MNTIKFISRKTSHIYLLLALCISFTGFTQKKMEKSTQTINVEKDVTVDLNLSHVEIEVDTWNRNEIKIEAYIESNKLSEEQLKEALKNWDLDVDGSGDYVEIKSSGTFGSWASNGPMYLDDDSRRALRELEMNLADLPDLPELPELPEMPEMPELVMPEMPEMPELPELPEGMHDVNFDYDAYKKDGEAYLDKWSKEYEEKYGKDYKNQMRAWAKEFAKIDWDAFEKNMEKWGEDFGKQFDEGFGKDWEAKMEAWGKKFGESFGKDYEKKMEAWGERFEKQMAQRNERMAERDKQMSKRHKDLARRKSDLAKRLEERHKSGEKRHELIKLRHEAKINTNVIKTLKITVPKKAKMKMNVRHGELKFSSVIHNLKADISHASLLANNIDGSETSINVSYSPVLIDTWSIGELLLNFVDHAQIKVVDRLVLNSNSSNLSINHIGGSAVIDGSFGDIAIDEIGSDFNNINIVLENSDALISLPNVAYNLQYKGNRSRLNHPDLNDERKTSFSSGDLASSKTIVINSKFSNVTMQK